MCDDPVNPADSAEFVIANHPSQLQIVWVGALIEHRRKDLFFSAVRSKEAFAIGFVNGERLFNEHMQPGIEGLNPNRRVRIMWRGDEDGIDFA